MAERAAHLVDRVFPEVAVRQWVLSLAQLAVIVDTKAGLNGPA